MNLAPLPPLTSSIGVTNMVSLGHIVLGRATQLTQWTSPPNLLRPP
jgi:hypothetical protein